MERYRVAHIRQSGQDMIIVHMDRSFGNNTDQQKQAVADSLTRCANSAGLAGIAVPVWDDGFGRMMSWAPRLWHPFFESIDWMYFEANINKELTCG